MRTTSSDDSMEAVNALEEFEDWVDSELARLQENELIVDE